jgi:hypothetical protein
VNPGARGLGIGQLLYMHGETFARSAGYEKMWLDSSRRFTQARRLFERNGFVLVEELDNDWEDNVYEKASRVALIPTAHLACGCACSCATKPASIAWPVEIDPSRDDDYMTSHGAFHARRAEGGPNPPYTQTHTGNRCGSPAPRRLGARMDPRLRVSR